MSTWTDSIPLTRITTFHEGICLSQYDVSCNSLENYEMLHL